MKLNFLILSICWIILITVLLVLPGSAFPKEDWLSKIWFDKWVHIGLYSILAVLLSGYVFKKFGKKKNKIVSLLTLGFAHGVVMEFVQQNFVANRSFDGGDIIADALGIILGGLFAWKFLDRFIK